MIGLFLVTHGTLGEALIQCVCHVLDKRPPLLGQLGLSAGERIPPTPCRSHAG